VGWTVEAGADPAQISVDRTGQYLRTVYYVAGKVSMHQIGNDGRLQFAWEATSGRLTPNTSARIETGANTGPRHLVWHPKLDLAYLDNEQGSSVTVYRLDKELGVLRPGETVSTLPDGFAGTNACAEIKIHSTGKFLYVSNRGHDSIAMFAVSGDGQKLMPLGQHPTEQTPRSFDISPSGRHLIVAGEGSGKLAVYAIDKETGKLQPEHEYPVASRLWWVLALASQ
jgi:6-phosphogluconolactonase